MGILYNSQSSEAQNAVTKALLEPGGFETILVLHDKSPRRTADLREVLGREGIVFDLALERMREVSLIQSTSDQIGLTPLGIDVSRSLLRWRR